MKVVCITTAYNTYMNDRVERSEDRRLVNIYNAAK